MPMTDRDAAQELEGAELVSMVEGQLAAVKELYQTCLEHDIAVQLERPANCGTGCAAKLRLLAREEDAGRIAALRQRAWLDMVQAEGTAALADQPGPDGAAVTGDDPPCPCCGTAAPLVRGACSDCGLQLE
jgi:hypothetical protein